MCRVLIAGDSVAPEFEADENGQNNRSFCERNGSEQKKIYSISIQTRDFVREIEPTQANH